MENNQPIKSLIALEGGAISVAKFMNEAMFNPKYGYYRTKKPIGKTADFITAPEISSLFGELIAKYFLSFILKSPKKIAFVEMGAGLGTLAFDVITTFEKLSKKLGKFDELKEKLNFNIIEISESLTKIQQEKLRDSSLEIQWFTNFDQFTKNNQNAQIYFLANELFDCFAIHQFARTNDKWQEILVALNGENLILKLENFDQQKHNLINKIAATNEITTNGDVIFEHSFEAQNFMQKLSQAIKNQGGMALIFDYGYYENPLKSTLQALKNHEKTDFLENIGKSDITALVNFKMLQKTAQTNGLQDSLISQRDFLRSLGIEKNIAQESSQYIKSKSLRKKNDQKNTSPPPNYSAFLQNCQEKSTKIDENNTIFDEKSAINRLIDENQMGNLFKCLILWKNEL